MKKQELLNKLAAAGMHPDHGLGQNFLMDEKLLDWIIRATLPKSGETILEVGPGFGALTSKLLETNANVIAVEFDHRLAAYLREQFAGRTNFRLVEADACKVNYEELLEGKNCRAIANLPYAISSVFIAAMTELTNPPEQMFFMLQKETGLRLSASCGTKSYGALTVRTQLCYDVSIAKIVPPQVFCPPPQVDSALVSFVKRDSLPPVTERKKIEKTVKLLFAQRRKQIGKLLAGVYGKENAIHALENCCIKPDTRPDNVTIKQYCQLTKELEK